MEILNFNLAPCGKTYYEINHNWKYIKNRIKNILDDRDSSRVYKIDLIIILLKQYKQTYLTSKGESNENR